MYADGNRLAILVDGGTMKLARPIRTDPEPAQPASGGRKMETRYRWDYLTGACLSEVNEQGETTVQYNNHPQTGELISERSDGEDIYHRYDGDGNTRQTADSADNVLGEATYDAFGEVVAESGDLKTTYRFRGQHGFSTDPLTEVVSKTSQNYSPSLGRALSGSFGGTRYYGPRKYLAGSGTATSAQRSAIAKQKKGRHITLCRKAARELMEGKEGKAGVGVQSPELIWAQKKCGKKREIFVLCVECANKATAGSTSCDVGGKSVDIRICEHSFEGLTEEEQIWPPFMKTLIHELVHAVDIAHADVAVRPLICRKKRVIGNKRQAATI